MAAFQLNPGENLLFQFYLFTLEDGQSWEGEWSDAELYNVGDVVIHNQIAYVALNPLTNSEPPSADWEAIPVVQSEDIKSLVAELRPNGTETPAVVWKYEYPRPSASNVKLEDGLLQLELLKEDSQDLEGFYDLSLQISSKAPIYIQSGVQTDFSVLENVIQVVVIPTPSPD